jgi:ParB/RepB/Spo0J family partition protein
MQIALSRIKSSPQPVRSSWDEQKLVELTQSIKEHGLLQAVKVRPVGDEYEVVFGHRRVEACRRLGLTHIEAVVEGVDDSTALVQALIENVVREDLNSADKAEGLQALKDVTGWSSAELARQVGMSPAYTGYLLRLLEEPAEIVNQIRMSNIHDVNILDESHINSPITEFHVRAIRDVGLSDEDKIAVLNKAAREGLTAAQTRNVALAFKRVENDFKAKRNLSELPLVRNRETLDVLVGYRKERVEKEEAKVYDHLDDLNVKAFVDAITTARVNIRAQWQLVDKDLIGAEHMPYLAKRLRTLAAELNSKASQLEKMREEEVDA